MRRKHLLSGLLTGLVTCLGLVLLPVAAANAADLKIGLQAVTTSMDPHYATSSANFNVLQHIYDPLVRLNNDTSVPEPWLAESWQVENDTSWVFKLRRDVKWHDGSPFTAEDVAFTYKRALDVPGSLTSFKTYLRPIKDTQVIDAHTIRIITDGPAPVLLDNLAYILIVSKKNGEGATIENYNSGKATIGTGPYKFVSFAPNETVVADKNPAYWRGAEPWDRLTLRQMTNTSTRIAALMAGDLDVIGGVPTDDIPKLKEQGKVAIWTRPSNYIVYFGFETNMDVLTSGKLTGSNGETLTENPFANPKVREAMKLAINTEALIKRVYDGYATASSTFVLPGNFSSLKDVKPWTPDEGRARALLTEAGWMNKIKLVIGTAPENTAGAVDLAQGLAQMFTRIGIVTTVENMPYTVLIQSRNARKLAVFAQGFNNVWGNAENYYATMMHSRTPNGEFGSQNYVRYSNAKFDELIDKGFSTVDNAKRRELYEQATRVLLADNIYLPLLLLHTTAATKPNIEIKLRSDSFILASNVRAKK